MVVQFRNLLESAITVKEIGICLGDFIVKNIPYKFFAISLLQENSSPRLLYQNSDSQFTFPENVRLEEKIYARRDALEQGINFEDISPLPFGDEVKVIINENAHTANFHAVVLLGEKKSEFKTSRDDIDFIETLAKSAIDAIEAASLKESLIRKELEAEKLAELNEQKSLFVSSVSHDLKTPLTSINLLAQQMRRKKNIPEDKVNHYLDVITGETERLTRLIDNVLHFSQMERGVKQFVMAPLILNDSLQNSLDLMKYQIKSEGFKLNTSISERKIRINGNHDALVECLINLFSNALKFGKPNNLIDVSLVSSGSEACITVRDFGIGMEEGEIKEIFNPFYRTGVSTAKKIPGTGLGLTIVKNIVDAHQGKIEVTSKPGEGTIIKLFFKECYEENSPD
ncbi:MAG: HAMP domain-containing histidine kinase [Bacteroidetes bacterium]|nr:HAMP domain-containing histidine kinase [Bacteroidota bacterium]